MNNSLFQSKETSIKEDLNPIAKIEHFYAVSNRPEELYMFFCNVLGLPEIWPFTNYGEFSSGGLSLGNVVLEIVGDDTESKEKPGAAYFSGIAFEPTETAGSMIVWLDKQGIGHSAVNPFKEVINGIEQVHWETFDVDIPPKDNRIFVCDYKNRKAVEKGRYSARLKLLSPDECPLRIQALSEIVLTLKDFDQGSCLWSNLLGAERQVSSGRFNFLKGPNIQLVGAAEDGIVEIILEVNSLTEAKRFLQSKQLLGTSSSDILTINKDAIQGLNVSLIEKC